MYRSTKGASKARRDQINAEIRNLKDLLPISDADKARLSYLHIMSLACMYTRKSVFFTQGRNECTLILFLKNDLLMSVMLTVLQRLQTAHSGEINKCFSGAAGTRLDGDLVVG